MYEHRPEKKCVIINQTVKIIYGEQFPFEKPKIEYLLKKNEKYKTHLCMFDLKKLEFRDIMKEDYHPSLNFAEIAERSLNFLTKNVISENEIKENASIFKRLSKIENEIEGFHWFATFLISTFFVTLIVASSFEPDDQTQKLAQIIKEHNLLHGHQVGKLDPFSSNLLVVYIFKLLSLIFASMQHYMKPEINMTFIEHLDYSEFYQMYALIMKIMALFLSVLFISIPTSFIVESLYKKNSNVFKLLLTVMCLTACGLYGMVGVTIDYQGILFVGLILWANAMLLVDNIVGGLIFYGFSLSASLDGLIFLPWIIYRVGCKYMKVVTRDQQSYIREQREGGNPFNEGNILNINGLNTILQYMHTASMALLFGLIVPMIPFFLMMDGMGRITDFNPFYDPLSRTRTFYSGFYPKNNELSIWMQVFGYTSQFIDSCRSPIVVQLGWIMFTNCLVIVLSRTNKTIGSHKKHLL